MDEKKLLESLSKMFGNPVDTTEMVKELKHVEKEKNLLKNFENIFLNRPIEIKTIEPIVEEVIEQEIVHEEIIIQEKIIVENPVAPLPEIPTDFVTAAAKQLKLTAPKETLPKENVNLALRKELDYIKKSIVDLHSFASQMSNMGGGGAGDINNLTQPVISISSNTYNITRKDYYVGVNNPYPTTIYLPTSIKNGRQVIVKDESSNCNINNITISTLDNSLIDNDGPAILAINNGSLTFMYNNGWKII